MAKKTLGGANLLKEATKEASQEKIDLQGAVLMTPAQIEALKQTKEKRTAGKMVYITPSEMDKFLSLIGRKTYSNAVRELILEFIKTHDKK
jgi:hypothetical protein